ncbi:FK506-binding protein 15 [Rhinichthys klamathensis goyatoka]|uniref:FK506-binding protein 15 n=1 Tax=Rhinichthys klamathensis goyatoka TaxID=3034132 RepID=UPI0024B526C6|nr:FK506-binding protein 15 [Rhinichthys klamathensis goyatoka]
MFATDDEDGDFLSPTGGAKLASLFGLDQTASKGNESFQYTAPKQPRKSSANSGPPNQKSAPSQNPPAVLFATAVHAYRYVNGQYVKQGKLGAAVLGNHTTKEHKILLYVSQQKPVTAARIHRGFVLTVQPSNYCTFYDDQRQNWSLMFESEKAATDFSKEVCLAKVNCGGPLDSVLTQDLLLGEGQAVENGDSLEVAYTGWLLQNHTIGQMFDSNLNKDKLLRLKLGAGKVVKGWEEGMLSMRKGGSRLMVIPPGLAYGSQGVPNRVPPDSTLVFEAEIRRVKFAKDVNSRDSASPAPSVESLGSSEPNQSLGSAPQTSKPSEPPLRAKSNSLSEQLSNPDATKAKLISRMAKMGQPMLPFIAGSSSSPSQPDSSDSELEDPSVSRRRDRNSAPSPQPVHITSAPPPSVQATALLPVTMATANPQPMMPGVVHAFQPVSQMYPTQTVPYQGTSDVTSFLMTEARQHNTEIRLAVGKVADKMDHLSSKIDDLQKQGSVSLGLSNVSMETAMIMHNIQRIIQENECLKKEVFEKSSRIEEQNRKISELINQNQRYVEQSNLMMEQRTDSLKNSSEQNQTRILQAEQDKHALPLELSWDQARLSEELASSTARVSELQLDLSSQQQKITALQTKLSAALLDAQQHNTHIAALEAQMLELRETADRVQGQYKMEKQKRKELELKLNNTEEELQDMRTEKDSLERTLSERKRKWQAERQRCDEELEEVRRTSQQEMDSLRSQLRKARTSTDHAAAEQLSQLQADLEQEWQVKCDQTLAAAREQQRRETTELTEHRDTLQLKLTQLQEKFNTLRQSRDSEEQRSLQQDRDQGEELQAWRQKCCALEERVALMKMQEETRVSEMEKKTDTAGEVKRVMNGVFQSLRGEFDLNETYEGSAVLRVLVNTIKSVTLQLLTKSERSTPEHSEEEEERESDARHVNGRREEDKQTDGDPEDGVEEEEKERKEKEQVSGTEDEAVEIESEQEVVEERNEEKVVRVEVNLSNAEHNVQDQDGETTHGEEAERDATPTQEVTTELLDDITPQEVTTELPDDITPQEQEVKVVDESVPGLTLGGPPKNPPPPPGVVHVTPAHITRRIASSNALCSLVSYRTRLIIFLSLSFRLSSLLCSSCCSLSPSVEEENEEEPLFQSPVTHTPTPAAADEEEEELSLKGRPPPTPLFGDESEDDDDLDWLG